MARRFPESAEAAPPRDAAGSAARNGASGAGAEPINRFFGGFSESTREYMLGFRERWSARDVERLLDAMRGLRVTVVGDTILDDYHFCRTLGTSSKDPALAVHHESSETFAGGVLAVANHLARFAGEVRLVSVLGERGGARELIADRLDPRVDARFVVRPGAPTTVKRRFIDGYFMSKLFEVYEMDDSPLGQACEAQLHAHLEEATASSDLVLAADFGHGAIGEGTRSCLVETAPFLAVNTQANAGNRGYHTIGRYGRADFASLSEGEIRLEFRDTRGELEPLLERAAGRLGARTFAVTRGQHGCLVKPRVGDAVAVPSFTPRIVDRVGAGDALFAVTSMAAFLDAPAELLGFVGNVVGGLAVEVMGNEKSIDRPSVERFVAPLWDR